MTIPKVETQRLNPNGPQIDDAALEKYLADRVYPLTGKTRCALEPPIVAPVLGAGIPPLRFHLQVPERQGPADPLVGLLRCRAEPH